MSELISVILPIYNVSDYIERCMNSIFAQTYTNLEIVMVDDGSDDGSAEICDEYASIDERVVVYHKDNGGISDARNFGVKVAKGEYITWIDPDDYVDKDYIEYLYSLLKKYNARMSICQHRARFLSGHVLEYGKHGDELIGYRKCIERLLYHDVIDTSVWGKLYDITLYEGIEFPYGKTYEDAAITYKMFINAGEIAVGYESKYNYMYRQSSIVNVSFSEKKLDLIDMTDMMTADIVRQLPELKRAALRRRVYARLSTLNQMMYVDGYDEKKREYIEYIKKRKRYILRDKKAPRRDKIGIIVVSINYKIYKLLWKLYLLKNK